MRMREDDREKATISSQPPMMPIVLDEAAIEDILGVRKRKCNLRNNIDPFLILDGLQICQHRGERKQLDS